MEKITEKEITDNISKNNVDWIELRKKFDMISDVDNLFYFLTEIVDNLNVCSSTECKIFPELHKLDLKRMNFLTQKTLQGAKENITHQIELKNFEKAYWDYIVFAKHIFNKIYAMKVTKDTAEIEIEAWHKRKIEMMNTSNKNSTPIQTEFQDEMHDGVKEIEAMEKLLFEQMKAKMMNQAK